MALLAFEAAYGLLLDLAYTLAGQVKLGAYLLKRHLLASYAEEHLEDLTLAVVKLLEGAVDLFRERFLSGYLL